MRNTPIAHTEWKRRMTVISFWTRFESFRVTFKTHVWQEPFLWRFRTFFIARRGFPMVAQNKCAIEKQRTFNPRVRDVVREYPQREWNHLKLYTIAPGWCIATTQGECCVMLPWNPHRFPMKYRQMYFPNAVFPDVVGVWGLRHKNPSFANVNWGKFLQF